MKGESTMKPLPEAFLQRMKQQLGREYPAFLACYDLPPARGLRVNTLNLTPNEFLNRSPFALVPSGMGEEGFLLADGEERVGRHSYHLAGLYYGQEPSAMLPVRLADIRPGMRVLDLCAAPGGKSGGAAAKLAGLGFLMANELVPGRAKILASTVERLGVANAAVTCARPEAVARAFPEYFDVVLVDAPCSGEGMFRKDDTAVAEWSQAHVLSCAQRQKAILESAALCVRGGGALVYSTCTFSPEENEGVVEGFLASHPDFVLERMERLYPHSSRGEGHFAARLARREGAFRPQEAGKHKLCREKGFAAFLEDTFAVPPKGQAFALPDGRVILLRETLPQGLDTLRLLSAGVLAGEITHGRLEPAHALFLGAHGGEFQRMLNLNPEGEDMAAYLAGETIPCPEEWRGWCAVAADGYPLGFGKAVDGMMKNHIPKGLRVFKQSHR